MTADIDVTVDLAQTTPLPLVDDLFARELMVAEIPETLEGRRAARSTHAADHPRNPGDTLGTGHSE